jgi:hypothetical protein
MRAAESVGAQHYLLKVLGERAAAASAPAGAKDLKASRLVDVLLSV